MKIIGITDMHHDSGACLINDGEVLYAVNEERLSRKKMDPRLPVASLMTILKECRGSDEVDAIAIGGAAPKEAYQKGSQWALGDDKRFGFVSKIHEWKKLWKIDLLGLFDLLGLKEKLFFFIDHHTSHAASAYLTSGFDKSIIITFDFWGDFEVGSINIGENGDLSRVFTFQFPSSPAIVYSMFTSHLGFKPLEDEGKVMALAAFGDRHRAYDTLASLISHKDNGKIELDIDVFEPNVDLDFLNKNALKELRKSNKTLLRLRELFSGHTSEDVAAALQQRIEEIMKSIVKFAISQIGYSKICLAGGIGLNVKVNKSIREMEEVEELFIHPHPGDGGLGVGAALFVCSRLAKEQGFKITPRPLKTTYLGPKYDSHEVLLELKKHSGLRFEKVNGVEALAAETLYKDNKAIGWFQGRMEYGPRALGNRSVLADPRRKENKERINKILKRREWFQPFAPSLLSEAKDNYLENACDSPFMILSFDTRREKREDIIAAVHVDGTARPQTVKKNVNPLFYELIEEFNKHTDVPAILNTSFNVHGEPIVCSPYDAINDLKKGHVDILFIADYVVERR